MHWQRAPHLRRCRAITELLAAAPPPQPHRRRHVVRRRGRQARPRAGHMVLPPTVSRRGNEQVPSPNVLTAGERFWKKRPGPRPGQNLFGPGLALPIFPLILLGLQFFNFFCNNSHTGETILYHHLRNKLATKYKQYFLEIFTYNHENVTKTI